MEGARRLAAGIGLEQVVRLERLVDSVSEAVDENTRLEGGLARKVREVEHSLVPVLEARQLWLAERAGHADRADALSTEEAPEDQASAGRG